VTTDCTRNGEGKSANLRGGNSDGDKREAEQAE
jgi:hypothetical protein